MVRDGPPQSIMTVNNVFTNYYGTHLDIQFVLDSSAQISVSMIDVHSADSDFFHITYQFEMKFYLRNPAFFY
jgi:hypothetical protein